MSDDCNRVDKPPPYNYDACPYQVGGLSATASMNIPNSLTILRILLIPVYIGFMTYGQYGFALLSLVLAGATDAIDGPHCPEG